MQTEVIIGASDAATVGAALAGAFGGLVGGATVQRSRNKGEIAKLKQARRDERERSFERAQTGYRALYIKFADDYERAVSNGKFDVVRRDFYEAQMVGFEPLKDALDQFWPRKQRLAGESPTDQQWDSVAEAFLSLAGLTLEGWENLEKPKA
jgi:hypothetical protein